MTTGNNYNDLKNLSFWIDNQKAFERHKKQLDNIYMNLHKRSVDEFGIRNKTYDLMQSKIKSVYEQHKFNEKEKSLQINKLNNFLGEKISSIHRRKNILINNQIDFSEKNKVLKKRIEHIKSIENEKIRKANEQLGKRILEKSPSVNLKKYNEEYQKTQYYKKFTKKFELPKIQVTGPIVIKRKLDLSPYNRGIRLGSFGSGNNSIDKSLEEETISNMYTLKGERTPQIRTVKKNFSQEEVTSNYSKKLNQD